MTLLRIGSGATLALFVLFVSGCLAKEVEDPCKPGPTFERYARDAERAARQSYEKEVPAACPVLDRPPDGNEAAEGLVFEEYAAVTSGSAGNFIDQNSWWVKALPRGELHLQTLQVTDAQCGAVGYEQFSFDYAATTPPVNPVPACGRSLSALEFGHVFYQTSPQLFQVEATAYARLVGLQLNPAFGTSLRFATEDATREGEQFPALTQITIAAPQRDRLGFVARLRGSTFEGVMQGELVAAAAAALHIKLRLFPRAGADPHVRLGVLAMSSMFWKGASDTPENASDEAHDADHLYVRTADGQETRVVLQNPEIIPEDPWLRRQYSGALQAIGLEQLERNPSRYLAYRSAAYASRPTMRADEIQSTVPLTAELSISNADSEYIDNLVLNLIAETNGAPGPIEVSYVLTASSI